MLNLGMWKCIKTFAPRIDEYGTDCYEDSYYHITKDGDDYRTDGTDSGTSVLFSLSELKEHFENKMSDLVLIERRNLNE